MPDRCLLYYITDRTAFAADETTRRRRLLEKISEAARAGIDYIQLREKDLPTRHLESLACEAIQAVREARKLTPALWPLIPALLINSRTDVALAAGADGLHLRSDDISPDEVRAIWRKSPVRGKDHVGTAALGYRATRRDAASQPPLIGISCHSPEEVNTAEEDGATFAVFAPVFEKKDVPSAQPAGLSQLRAACQARIPVLALGGITLQNAEQCLEAGAAGFAAIRLFQENDVAKIADSLRQLFR